MIFIACIVFIFFEQKKNESNVCEKKNFRDVAMPSEDTKILEFSLHQKSDKTPSIIYANLESLIKRINKSETNFEKQSTKNKNY